MPAGSHFHSHLLDDVQLLQGERVLGVIDGADEMCGLRKAALPGPTRPARAARPSPPGPVRPACPPLPQDIEDLPVVDGVRQVVVLLAGRHGALPGAAVDERVRVLQRRCPRAHHGGTSTGTGTTPEPEPARTEIGAAPRGALGGSGAGPGSEGGSGGQEGAGSEGGSRGRFPWAELGPVPEGSSRGQERGRARARFRRAVPGGGSEHYSSGGSRGRERRRPRFPRAVRWSGAGPGSPQRG